jgi:hypothetical protein
MLDVVETYCASQLRWEVQHTEPRQSGIQYRFHNHTLYDIPPIPFVIEVTQKDLRSSLMMADYCRNM